MPFHKLQLSQTEVISESLPTKVVLITDLPISLAQQ